MPLVSSRNANGTKRPGEFVSFKGTFTAIGFLRICPYFQATIRRQCSLFSQTRSFSGCSYSCSPYGKLKGVLLDLIDSVQRSWHGRPVIET